MTDDFQHCIYCGADCYADDPDHAQDCPSVTNVWPVTERDLGIRGPNDPYAHGMTCVECAAEFKVGDHYTHRDAGRGSLIPGVEAPIFECICLGCAATEALA